MAAGEVGGHLAATSLILAAGKTRMESLVTPSRSNAIPHEAVAGTSQGAHGGVVPDVLASILTGQSTRVEPPRASDGIRALR